MKYLKKFESRSELDIHEVLDVFKDFADEFVAKYRDFEQLGDRVRGVEHGGNQALGFRR